MALSRERQMISSLYLDSPNSRRTTKTSSEGRDELPTLPVVEAGPKRQERLGRPREPEILPATKVLQCPSLQYVRVGDGRESEETKTIARLKTRGPELQSHWSRRQEHTLGRRALSRASIVLTMKLMTTKQLRAPI